MTSEALQNLIKSGRSFRQITNTHNEELLRYRLKGKALRSIRSMAPYLEEAKGQLQKAEEFGAKIVTIADQTYPASLREIWSPPTVLYVWGELPQENEGTISIVGTRTASTYGRIAAEKYAEAFARFGITVVSGLARGIDTWAHKATLRVGGKTIAVVASGLDQIQPSLATQLAVEISQDGGVITEHRFGIKALRPYFPQRNRIISGITSGTLVVESDAKGGALITARFALDQNREVFALPGPISSPKSNGTNNLIRTDRARLTQTPEDVLDALGYHIPHLQSENTTTSSLDLTAFEHLVYEQLNSQPIHVDDLCEKSGLSSSDILVTLLSLEFKGLVRQMAGKMFLRR